MIERIKKLMKERGLNGVQLAAETGLPKNAISEWSNGKAKPSTDAIIKLAEYFNVTTDYLLGISVTTKCTYCEMIYSPDISSDIEEHRVYHGQVRESREKYGFFYTHRERERIKNEHEGKYPLANKDEKVNLAEKYFQQYFSRSLEGSGFSRNHVSFEDYAGMLLNQKRFKEKFGDIYSTLVKTYMPRAGIKEGYSYYEVDKDTVGQYQSTNYTNEYSIAHDNFIVSDNNVKLLISIFDNFDNEFDKIEFISEARKLAGMIKNKHKEDNGDSAEYENIIVAAKGKSAETTTVSKKVEENIQKLLENLK